jgi:hypothetical protein
MLSTDLDLQELVTGGADGVRNDDNEDLFGEDLPSTPDVSSVSRRRADGEENDDSEDLFGEDLPPTPDVSSISRRRIVRRDAPPSQVTSSGRVTRSVSRARRESSSHEVDELESNADRRAMPPPSAIPNRRGRTSVPQRPAPGKSVKKAPKKTKRRSTGGVSRTLDLDTLAPSSAEIPLGSLDVSGRARAMTIEMVDAMAKLRIEDEVSLIYYLS